MAELRIIPCTQTVRVTVVEMETNAHTGLEEPVRYEGDVLAIGWRDEPDPQSWQLADAGTHYLVRFTGYTSHPKWYAEDSGIEFHS